MNQFTSPSYVYRLHARSPSLGPTMWGTSAAVINDFINNQMHKYFDLWSEDFALYLEGQPEP